MHCIVPFSIVCAVSTDNGNFEFNLEKRQKIYLLKIFLMVKFKIYFCTIGFFVSNQQKVQFNTDLLKHKTLYLYTK
jgi:hypothetical protein